MNGVLNKKESSDRRRIWIVGRKPIGQTLHDF